MGAWSSWRAWWSWARAQRSSARGTSRPQFLGRAAAAVVAVMSKNAVSDAMARQRMSPSPCSLAWPQRRALANDRMVSTFLQTCGTPTASRTKHTPPQNRLRARPCPHGLPPTLSAASPAWRNEPPAASVPASRLVRGVRASGGVQGRQRGAQRAVDVVPRPS